MQAVILAGGKGTRLRPYTTTIPKPLVPVGEDPIVSIVIRQLKAAGATKLTLAVNHMAEFIMRFLGTGEQFGIEIAYSREEKPLGTVGPIKRIRDLPENFLVMNGDILTDLDYKELFAAHQRSGAEMTVGVFERDVRSDFGVLEINRSTGRVERFQEKPVFRFDVSMGVYVFNRSVLNLAPDEEAFGFDTLLESMLKLNRCVNTYRHSGYWLDLGRPDDYDRANQDAGLFKPAGAPA